MPQRYMSADICVRSELKTNNKNMKKLLCLLVPILWGSVTNGQVLSLVEQQEQLKNDESRSNALAFASKDGALITKTYYPLGRVRSGRAIAFDVILFEDVLKKEKTACLRLWSTYNGTDYYGYLDVDEIDAFFISLLYIQDVLLPSKPTHETDCEFKTRAGVRFKAVYRFNEWTLRVQPNIYSSSEVSFINANEHIRSIKDIIVRAKATISELMEMK